MRGYSPVQPGYTADGHSPLVVKHADTKSKLWKTAAMVFVSACFTTTGCGVDSLPGVIKGYLSAERRLYEEAGTITGEKRLQTPGSGLL